MIKMLCHYQGRPQVHSWYWGAMPPILQRLQWLTECAEKQVFTNCWETWIWIQCSLDWLGSLSQEWALGLSLLLQNSLPENKRDQLAPFMEPKEVRTDLSVRKAHQERDPSNSWRLKGRHLSCTGSDCRPSNSCPSWNFSLWPYWEVCPLQIYLVKLGWGHTVVKSP